MFQYFWNYGPKEKKEKKIWISQPHNLIKKEVNLKYEFKMMKNIPRKSCGGKI